MILSTTQVRCAIFVFFFSSLLVLPAAKAEVSDAFADGGKLRDVWTEQRAAAGVVSCAPGGVTLKAEAQTAISIKQNNAVVGTDDHPLLVGVFISTEASSLMPGLHIYWDNDNLISLFGVQDEKFRLSWRSNGTAYAQELPLFWKNAAQTGVYVRAQLISRNVFVSLSLDGCNWRQIYVLNMRPKTGVAPNRIILGRGAIGAKPDLANDVPAAGNKVVQSLFRDFQLYEGPETLPAEPFALDPADSWIEAVAAQEAKGFPRNWTVLSPHPDPKFGLFFRKQALEAETSDQWNGLKDEAGKPYSESKSITLGDEEKNKNSVDIEDLFTPATGITFARTEFESPITGPALIWMNTSGMAAIYVNNRQIYTDRENERPRGRICAAAALKKGVNIIKVKLSSERPPLHFSLRVERNDALYRVQFVEKLAQLYPTENSWRRAEARLELARRYEQLGDYSTALKAWNSALLAPDADDEAHVAALEGKLRLLESLQHWSELAQAGDSLLNSLPVNIRHSRGPSQDRAFRACVLGWLMSSQQPAAQGCVDQWLAQVGKDAVAAEWILRTWAAAAESANLPNLKIAALNQLAHLSKATPLIRTRAAFEAALLQASPSQKTGNGEDNLKNASLAAQSGVHEILTATGGGGPQLTEWARQADEDFKAGKFERALAGYWGVGVMGLPLVAHPAQTEFVLNKAYALPELGVDPATRQRREYSNQVEQDSFKIFDAATGDAPWQGAGWRAIGPFDNTNGIAERTDQGPENDVDFTGKHPGRGGERAWCDLNPADLNYGVGPYTKEIGDARGGVVYLGREFLVPGNDGGPPVNLTLFLSVTSAWTVWVDGKKISSINVDYYQIDKNQIPLQLSPGKHRFLLKAPVVNQLLFSARFGIEKEPARQLLRVAWLRREFPQNTMAIQSLMESWKNSLPIDTYEACAPLASLEPGTPEWGVALYMNIVSRNGTGAITLGKWLLDRTNTITFSNSDLAWRVNQLLFDVYRNHCDLADCDALLAQFINRHPEQPEAAVALALRGAVRQDFRLAPELARHYVRLVYEYPWLVENGYHHILAGLHGASTYAPDRHLFDAESNERAQTAFEAATRQIHEKHDDAAKHALEELLSSLRAGSGGLIRVGNMYASPREALRLLVSALPAEMRTFYIEQTTHDADLQLLRASSAGTASAYESAEADFPFTEAGAQSLNQAGNVYLDRGAFQEASAVFFRLAQDYRGLNGFSAPIVQAKLAWAQIKSGAKDGALATAQELVQKYGAEKFKLGGKEVSGSEFAERIQLAAKQLNDAGRYGLTHLANIQRTGPPATAGSSAAPMLALRWALPLSPSASMARARETFPPDLFPHIQSNPVISEGRVFIGAQEWIQAIDLKSGRMLWRADGALPSFPTSHTFSGFPVSSPTVQNGRVYLRFKEIGQSELQCREAESGRVLWNSAAIPELSKVIWLNDPVVTDGVAAGVFIEQGEWNWNSHGIAAIDAQTGKLRWKRHLVTGITGVTVYRDQSKDSYASSLQLGPAAADKGLIYTPTGLNSFAAVYAQSGDVAWAVTYPRLETGYFDNALSGDLTRRFKKVLGRGLVSPMVCGDVVLFAPKDNTGVIALDRSTGATLWHKELQDNPFFCGVCDGNALLADTTVRAVATKTGWTAWESTLEDDELFGQPGFDGGMMYVPGRRALHFIDARSGKKLGRMEWDRTTGPLAALQVGGTSIIGAGEHLAAALEIGQAIPNGPEISLLEAQALALHGNSDAALERFAAAAKASASDELPRYLSAWVRAAALAGKGEGALAAARELLADKPEQLDCASVAWSVSRTALLEGLAAFASAAPAKAEVELGIPAAQRSGPWVTARYFEGDNCEIFDPPGPPSGRFYFRAGSSFYCVKTNPLADLLWRTSIGSDTAICKFGAGYVLLASGIHVTILDRLTGEPVWKLDRPYFNRSLFNYIDERSITDAAIDNESLVLVLRDVLYVYDMRTHALRWTNARSTRRSLCVDLIDGKLAEFTSPGQNDQEGFLTHYDLQSGAVMTTAAMGKVNENAWGRCSADHKYFVFQPNNHTLVSVDVVKCARIGEIQVPPLNPGETPWMHARFSGHVLRYSGSEKNWMTVGFDAETAKQVYKIPGLNFAVGQSFVKFGGAQNAETLVRLDADADGTLKETWQGAPLPGHLVQSHYALNAVVQDNKVNVFFAHGYRGGNRSDLFVLRTFDWGSGQMQSNTVVPGVGFRNPGLWYRDCVEFPGGLIAYGALEGVYVLAPAGAAKDESVSHLREALADPKLPSTNRKQAARELMSLDAPVLKAFNVPASSLSNGVFLSRGTTWNPADAVPIEGPIQVVPLNESTASDWSGPADLSAKLYATWSSSHVMIAIDVRDDHFVPPAPGLPLHSGDSVRIALNSNADPEALFGVSDSMIFDMALVEGQTVVRTYADRGNEMTDRPLGRIASLPDNSGVRYELALPWSFLRPDAQHRPGNLKELRLSAAVYDNDGQGTRDALEWGGGIVHADNRPASLQLPSMGVLSLVDVSRDKIERLRTVIDKLPDAPQIPHFLDMINMTKRGTQVLQDQAAEMEGFLKSHPTALNCNRALSRLIYVHEKMGDKDAAGKALESAKAARCSTETLADAAKVFRVWVMPGEKNPPQMIMVQFKSNEKPQRGEPPVARGYWGVVAERMGHEDTPSQKRLGSMPKPGQWTLLEIRAIDLEIESWDMASITFSVSGGQAWFDRASISADGKESVLIENALGSQYKLEGPLQFSDTPKRADAKPFTLGVSTHLTNATLTAAGPVFSFRSAAAKSGRALDPALLREAAGILSDAPEGLLFLKQILEAYGSEAAARKNYIDECENYLVANPGTIHAVVILKDFLMRAYGENALQKCEAAMEKARLPRATQREFHREVSPAWTSYQIFGPFPAEGGQPANGGKIRPDGELDLHGTGIGIGNQTVSWTRFGIDDPKSNGYVNLSPLIKSASDAANLDAEAKERLLSGCCAYAYLEVTVPSRRNAVLFFGAHDSISIWVNKKKEVSDASNGGYKDMTSKDTVLNAGVNKIVILCSGRDNRLGFFFRIADENGRPFDDLTLQKN